MSGIGFIHWLQIDFLKFQLFNINTRTEFKLRTEKVKLIRFVNNLPWVMSRWSLSHSTPHNTLLVEGLYRRNLVEKKNTEGGALGVEWSLEKYYFLRQNFLKKIFCQKNNSKSRLTPQDPLHVSCRHCERGWNLNRKLCGASTRACAGCRGVVCLVDVEIIN